MTCSWFFLSTLNYDAWSTTHQRTVWSMRTVIVNFRPFSVQKIPRSNLILLVVDTLCPCGSKQLSITPQEVNYESLQGVAVTTRCRVKPQETMYRRRPPKCMNYHPEVSYQDTQLIFLKNCGCNKHKFLI